MEISTDQLARIKEYAGYLLKPEQIARLLDIDPDNFKRMLKQKDHAVTVAYEKGKLETILDIRKQEIELAKLGSPIALDLIDKFIVEQKQGER